MSDSPRPTDSTANRVHPTAIIGPEVELGSGNVIGPYCVFQGRVVIGDNNFFASHGSFGGPAEVRGHPCEPTWEEVATDGGVLIGSHNVFKEFVTVNTGWSGQTRVGDHGYIMGKTHIAHDCCLGDRVTMSCGALLGGHSSVEDDATLGLGITVHQWLVIGAGSMLGMQAAITRHVPPFTVNVGAPARPTRLNTVRLERLGVDDSEVRELEGILLKGLPDTSGLSDRTRLAVEAWLDRTNTAGTQR